MAERLTGSTRSIFAPASARRVTGVVREDVVLRLLAIVVAGAWTGYFFFTGMPQFTLDVFPATITLHIMFGVAAVIYLLLLALTRRLPGGTPLDLAVLGFLAAYALATYTSASWRISLDATLQIGAAVIAFYALADVPGLSARSLVRALQLAGVALALYALWVVGDDYADYLRLTHAVEGIDASNVFPPSVPRVHDVSDHPNVLAMLLVLFMPFFALSALSAERRWERGAVVAALVVSGMAIFLTLSRGGWIGAGVGLAFTAAGVFVTLRTHEHEHATGAFSWRAAIPSGLSPTAVAAAGGALVLVVGGTLAFLSSASRRPGWLFRSSLSPREDAWDAGLDIFRDNPLTGAGPNAFGLLYPEYSGKFLIHTQHAHNGFLQVADDAGIVGLLALAAIAAAVAFMLWRTWRQGTLEQRLLAVACGGALLGFSAHNQLDAGNVWKAPAIALALVGAIVVRNYREQPLTYVDRPTSLRSSLPEYGVLAVRASLLALLALPFLAWYRIDRGHYDYYRGMNAFYDGEPVQALARLQEAVDQDSSLGAYRLQLGQQQAMLYMSLREKDRPLIEAAVVNLERAVALDKRSTLAHANLARVYRLAGRDDDAAQQAEIVRFISRGHVPPVLMVAELYEEMGREQQAIETYGQVISMDAGLADSAFWQATDFRRAHFPQILDRSVLGVNPCTRGGFLVQAHRSDPQASLADLGAATDGCKLLLLSFPNDLVLRVALAKMLMEQDDMAAAFGHLDFAVHRQPDFGPARTELGRWYQRQDDLDAARHQWLLGGQLDDPESLLLLGDSYPPADIPAGIPERLRALLPAYGSTIRNDLISVLYYRFRWGRVSPFYALIPAGWQTAVPRLHEEMQRALERWQPG